MEYLRNYDGAMTRREVIAGALCALALVGCGRATVGEGSAPASEEEKPVVLDKAAESDEQSEGIASQDADHASSWFAEHLAVGEVSSIRLIGDSITAGFGCDGYGATTDLVIYDGPEGRFRETAPEVSCWANDFRAYAETHGVASFVNAGISGAKMRWLAENPAAWIGDGADVIFVMLGTNDAVYHTQDEYREFAEKGLTAVSEACGHLVVMAPTNNNWSDYEPSFGPAELEPILRDISNAHGWDFISFLNVLELGSDQFLPDQCHPTSKGSHDMWTYLKAALGL